MELFLNCIWLALGLSLLIAWSTHAWQTRIFPQEDVLPSRQLQITALLLLIALLFPVISVTDDFAMCAAPRDAESAMRLHDLVDGSQPAQTIHPIALPGHCLASLLHLGPSWPLEFRVKIDRQLAGALPAIDSRPPPVTL